MKDLKKQYIVREASQPYITGELELPLYGDIAAGALATVEPVTKDNIEYIKLPKILLRKYANCKNLFALKVNGENQHSIQYYVLFTLLARTGLRIREALALTWDDIDFENKTLTVNKTLVYPTNSTPYLSTPKTKASLRTIKLEDVTIRLLKKHRINRNEMYLMYSNYKKPETNIVFHQHDGRWLRTNVVREYFKEVCKRAGLPVLSPHALRHTHAVHLLEAGANIKYVSERLGHASIKMTADTYLHVTKKIEDEALELYQRYTEKI
jgi:integrase